MSRDKIPTMEHNSCFFIGTREESLDAVSCLRCDGIDTSSYVWIRKEEERDTRKLVHSEKSHWLTTKMNVRSTLTIFFTKSWNHRKNSQSCEESGGFDFAEKSFHSLVFSECEEINTWLSTLSRTKRAIRRIAESSSDIELPVSCFRIYT